VSRRLAGVVVVVVVALAGVIVAIALTRGGDDASAPSTTTATPASTAAKPAPAAARPAPALRSRPDLRPPRVTVASRVPTADADGWVMLTPRAGANGIKRVPGQQQGPLMLDEQGRVRWFRPMPNDAPATDLRVQRYQGKPVLTFWRGAMPELGVGSGVGVILDRSYRRIATVRAGNDQSVDLHEMKLTSRGTALVTIYDRARRDLSAIGGARNAQVTEGIVQEIDVVSGRVLLEWHSLDHVDPAESVMQAPTSADDSFDYFHINSVDDDGHGHLLISARHTSAVYQIDRRTGDVRWRLGGKRSDFAIGAGADFALQHDARYLGDDQVRIFDNGDQRARTPVPSSVKVLTLDRGARRATLARRVEHPERVAAESQGNVEALADGGLFVGWGSTGAFTRFDADGAATLEGQLAAGYDSYRAFLDEWTAAPATRPRISVAASDAGGLTIHVSWNGATEVRRWQLLTGPDRASLRPVGRRVAWDGLETTLDTSAGEAYVAVRALDASGSTLGTSRIVPAP
jgi:hypothetical protein